jgi:transcriptional regulator with XRE-family HTH domain
VAMLAGISSEYYLRLEQGRDRNPSVQVLEAIAEVLRLNADTTAYMISLTRVRPAGTRRPWQPETVPTSVLQLIDGWTANPAFVQNRFTDVLAGNVLAAALSPNFTAGVNLLRAVFLDESSREIHRGWEEVIEEGVAGLRAHVGPDVDDPRLTELVGELSAHSDHFRRLWSRHDVRPKRGGVARLRHPKVGDIELQKNKLTIGGANDLILVVFHAEPGSRNAELLETLCSLATSDYRIPRAVEH